MDSAKRKAGVKGGQRCSEFGLSGEGHADFPVRYSYGGPTGVQCEGAIAPHLFAISFFRILGLIYPWFECTTNSRPASLDMRD